MSRLPSLRDERGTTLMEVLVALSTGMVVLAAISAVIVVSLRETGKINAKVDANQRARIALNKIVDQLHSACIAPQIAPVQVGSTGTLLSFIHQTGSAVAPTPVLTKINLEGTTLSQSDYAATGGQAPAWTFSLTPTSTRQLMTKISATSPSTSIFSYYSYTNGQVSATPLTTPLTAESTARTVKVAVAFTASPLTTTVKDANAAANIQSSAVLRLTPASFSSGGVNLPCQ
jgi:Tfp pilus assembly protein PilW